VSRLAASSVPQARARARREATDEWLENGEPAEPTRNEMDEWPTVRVDAACVLLQRPEPTHYLAKRGTPPKKVRDGALHADARDLRLQPEARWAVRATWARSRCSRGVADAYIYIIFIILAP